MKVKKLYLELTRMCTIECEHCLRGERKEEYMSEKTINNIFKDINEVEFLLLTGGEPLLALNQIKKILEVIKEKNIKINCVLLVTNCTVLNEGIMKTLSELSSLTDFEIRLSYDMFHYMELNRLNLLETRQENAEVFKGKFKAEDYSDYQNAPQVQRQLIYPIGRASHLSSERLNEINKMGHTNYAINNRDLQGNSPSNIFYMESTDTLGGIINIDVNGNVTSSVTTFEKEDEESKKCNSNINELGLLQAALNRARYEVNPNLYKEEQKKLNKTPRN